ncbi:hypothetical protein GCM10023195_32180 [Actinoallomurus liliacearum]|uniref:Uncharacterized protein n=2 Tax=Actinoallomurus liliacearum TaxID=1080073 RepID=A0ABP8TJU9_9ACTN
MQAHTTHTPSIDVIKAAVLRLAPLLIRQGLNVTVDRDGTVEVRNPRNTRMSQPLVLRVHQGGLWWHWQWSGTTRDAPSEYEPMVPAEDVDEAGRRIVNVLRTDGTAGAEQ